MISLPQEWLSLALRSGFASAGEVCDNLSSTRFLECSKKSSRRNALYERIGTIVAETRIFLENPSSAPLLPQRCFASK